MFENHTSPWMDEELHIMRDAVRKFLAREFVPHMAKWEKQGCVDRDAWNKAGAAGLLCVSIPPQYGGGGGNCAFGGGGGMPSGGGGGGCACLGQLC